MADADPAKMHVWLSYVFNLEHMEKAVKPLWARVLDLAFINVSRDPYFCIFSLLRKVFIVRYPPQNDIFGTLRKHMKDAEHTSPPPRSAPRRLRQRRRRRQRRD